MFRIEVTEPVGASGVGIEAVATVATTASIVTLISAVITIDAASVVAHATGITKAIAAARGAIAAMVGWGSSRSSRSAVGALSDGLLCIKWRAVER